MNATKIKLIGGDGFGNLYTGAVLQKFITDAGMELVDHADEADYIFASLCDPDDLDVAKKAHELAKGKPVIMGGFESYFCIPYFAWVDHVVVGEGYDFIKKFGQDPEEALDMDCVMSSPDDVVYPSYNVPFNKYPLLKVPGRNRFYFLTGKGCRGNCKFCGTNWVQPYQQASKYRVKNVLRSVEKKKWGKINLISNDSGRVYESGAINAQSCRIQDYLKEPNRYKSNMLHFGIEAWTEEKRREWGKPVSNEEIREAMRVTREQSQECEFFFIVGYKGWSMDKVKHFAETVIPANAEKGPRIYMKMTYFDAVPHTPLADEDINLSYCDTKEVFNIMNSRVTRMRVFPTRSAGRSAWRSILHRCDPEEAEVLGKQPKTTNTETAFAEFVQDLKDKGLEHRLTTPNEKYDNIKVTTSMRQAKERGQVE